MRCLLLGGLNRSEFASGEDRARFSDQRVEHTLRPHPTSLSSFQNQSYISSPSLPAYNDARKTSATKTKSTAGQTPHSTQPTSPPSPARPCGALPRTVVLRIVWSWNLRHGTFSRKTARIRSRTTSLRWTLFRYPRAPETSISTAARRLGLGWLETSF